MGKKYIIELLDDCPSEFKGIIVFGLTPEGQISAEPIPVEDLTPYTEPDLEQVRKEAYHQGLSDAWECARKIAYMHSEERKKVFGENLIRKIQDIYSASEAIKKIRQYEQEKEEQIQVGDEVDAPFGKAIVVNIDSAAKKIWVMYADGRSGFDFFKNAPTKTGRHFPEIAEVLQKMKETDNG